MAWDQAQAAHNCREVAEEGGVDIHWEPALELLDLAHILLARIEERMGYGELGLFEELLTMDVLESPRKYLGLAQVGRMELIVDRLVEVERAALLAKERVVFGIVNALVGGMIEVFAALVARMVIAEDVAPRQKLEM